MLDFLSIDVGSLLFTLLNTLILFLVIKHFLFGRVHAVLEARQQEVAKTYQDAEDASRHASELEEKYTTIACPLDSIPDRTWLGDIGINTFIKASLLIFYDDNTIDVYFGNKMLERFFMEEGKWSRAWQNLLRYDVLRERWHR